MSAPPLSTNATSALQSAAILLRDTRGFMFLPLFADSERAASSGLDFLKAQLSSEFYTVAWPLDKTLSLGDQRIQLLSNLDDAIGKLPPDTVVVLNATGSLRHDLALEAVAYINHRREPLRTAGLRLVLCWPAAFKDELLSNAPDLWSVRAVSPWVVEADMAVAEDQAPFELDLQTSNAKPATIAQPAMAQNLVRWQQHRNLQKADFSLRDALDMAIFQYKQSQWASAAELAEAVFLAQKPTTEDLRNDPMMAVKALNVLSSAQSRLGNLQGALEATKLAVNIARRSAKANPAAYEPELAMSINNLANRLGETGERPGALKAAQEAVDIRRRLVKINPTVNQPDLAASINNLANRLSQTGDRPSALKAAQEAVDIYKRLVKTSPADLEPSLAASISNLANCLSETGDRPGALKAAQEAVDIYKRLAKTNPTAFEPELAMSINNLANRLSQTGDRLGALKAAQEALDIYKRLAKINPAAFEPNLAAGINNLANFLSETGDRLGALKAAREAVDIRRRLVKTNAAAYEPDFAGSFSNLANFLSETGDHLGAINAAREAVALYEKVNLQTPGAFDQQLAIARRVLDQLQ